MPQKNIRYIVLVVTLLVVIIVGVQINNGRYTATLKIEATPQDATILVNKKSVKTGISKVRPGSYTVTVSRTGFKSESSSFTVAKDETRYVGVPLTPNSAATASWYSTHPEDAKVFEGISSKNFDQNSTKSVAAQPFLKLLPFTAAGFEFKIDYGPSLEEPDSTKQAIYISANTQEARADALTWIRNQGFDPKKMEIVYQSSPELDQPVNNTNTSL